MFKKALMTMCSLGKRYYDVNSWSLTEKRNHLNIAINAFLLSVLCVIRFKVCNNVGTKIKSRS